MWAHDLLSGDQSQDAISLLEGGRKRIAGEWNVIDEKSKEQVVRIHLLLVEAYLHIGNLEKGSGILDLVWTPESQFYIDTLDKNFLWMSQLYRRVSNKQQCDPTSCSHQAPKQRQMTLYEVSASFIDIPAPQKRSANLTLNPTNSSWLLPQRQIPHRSKVAGSHACCIFIQTKVVTPG
jgi:hypothetical protein